MRKKKQCDICLEKNEKGIQVKPVGRGWPPWKRIFVCEKCKNTVYELVRSYRRDRF